MRKHKLVLSIALALALTLSSTHSALAADPLALEANWVANTVKITFDSNGGGVPPDYQIYAYGVSRSMPGQCSMSKANSQFLGWAESSTATVPKWKAGDTSTEAFGYASETQAVAKTLYAVWTPDSVSTIADFLGYGKSSVTPTSSAYNTASLVEKVNYLESELTSLKSSVSAVQTRVNSLPTSAGGGKITYVTSGVLTGGWQTVASGINGYLVVSIPASNNSSYLPYVYVQRGDTWIAQLQGSYYSGDSCTIPIDSSGTYKVGGLSGWGVYAVYRLS